MQMLSRTALRSSIVGAATAALMAAAPVASAAETPDERAVAHDKNATSCDEVGFAGTLLDPSDLTASKVESQERYLTIRAVSDGITITGIVVKGGDGYNVYVPGERGLAEQPPWEHLRAPLNGGGKVPAISHWFACGKSTPDTTTTTASGDDGGTKSPEQSTPATDSPTASTTTDTVASTTTPGGAGGAGTPVTSISTSAGVAAETGSGGPEELANTGFSGRWLVPFGAVLVLAGAAALVLLRVRRSRV